MSETQQQNDNQTQQPAPAAPENQPQQPQAPQQQGQPQPPFGQAPQQPQQPQQNPYGNMPQQGQDPQGQQFQGQRGSSMFNIDPKDAKQMMSRPPQRVSIISAILFFVVAMFIGSQMMTMMNGAETDTLITSEFVQAVEQDRVQNVVYDAGSYTVTGTYYPAATAGSTASDAYNNAIGALNAQVQGSLGTDAPTVDTTNLDAKSVGTPRKYTSTYVGQDSLMQLLKSHPDVEYQVKLPDGMGDFLMSLLPTLLLIGLMVFFFAQMNKANNSQMSFGKAKAKEYTQEHPDVRFDDVAGEDEAVEELQEIKDFLVNPKKYQDLGAKIPRGCLLVGPPGTGKTLLARAVAGEAQVPFFSISGSEFVEMFVGVGASRVRDLFKHAKESAPSIIFIDEIDAVGRQRGAGLGGGHDEREQTLNQLLVEMDGFDNDTNLIIIAATNRPDVLDPALLRPGRFDRQVAVEAPDLEGREAILKVHAKGKPFVPDVDLHMIAVRTPGFTGADLANVLNEAALLCARAGAQLIDNRAIDEAIDRVQAGPKRRSKGMALDELRNTAYHEGGHALVAAAMNDTDPVTKVTILPRGRALGYTAVMPTEDRYSMSRNQLLDQMAYAMGGRTAEEVVFHDPTTGASNDIEKATNIARQMVLDYGFSEKLGAIKWSDDEQSDLGALTHKYSAHTAEIIDEEVLKLVETAHTEAWNVINENRDILDELVRQLLVKETLNEKELAAIFANIKKAPKREVWLSDEKRPDSDIPPVPIPDKLKQSAGLTN